MANIDMNQVYLTGRVCRTMIADEMSLEIKLVSERKSNNGTEVNYIPVKFIGSIADAAKEKIFHRARISVEGFIRQQQWKNAQGEYHCRLIVVGLGFKVLETGSEEGY